MRFVPSSIRRSALVALSLLLLCACATTLAPTYDKAIADGLVTVNERTMQLFAATSSGTTAASFTSREKTYNEIIGSLDALANQARARPIPKNLVTKKVNEYLSARGVDALEGNDAPSAAALESISKTITKMRDTDKKQGVTPTEVIAFKGQTIIYFDQALTYESFLAR